jgi:hypothetical protein
MTTCMVYQLHKLKAKPIAENWSIHQEQEARQCVAS